MGWGSGSANFPYLVDPFAAMQAFIHSIRSSVVIEGMLNDYNYVQAKAIARQADICVVFAVRASSSCLTQLTRVELGLG